MLARLQQAITIGLIALATAWAAYFAQAGHPIQALVGALLIVLGYVLFLALEFILLAFIQEREPTPRPTARQLFGAWWVRSRQRRACSAGDSRSLQTPSPIC
jgi:hypothetical protein